LEKSRANLERFAGYSLDQGLMAKKIAVEELYLGLNWARSCPAQSSENAS
jgi:hypothetical protein